MLIHTLIELLTLVHEIREQSVELAHHLRVAQALCKFVPDGDHSTDRTARLPQPPCRAPGLALLLLLLQVALLTHSWKVFRRDKDRIKGGRDVHTFQKVMTIPGCPLLFYSIFVKLTR